MTHGGNNQKFLIFALAEREVGSMGLAPEPPKFQIPALLCFFFRFQVLFFKPDSIFRRGKFRDFREDQLILMVKFYVNPLHVNIQDLLVCA